MHRVLLLLVIGLVSLKPTYAEQAVVVQVLGINDFHGNLEPPTGSSGKIAGIDAGGVEYLATHIKKLKEQNPHTVVVSAGDLLGASPLISALFHDEPTIEAMNLLGLDINAVGNHELDDGWPELLRLQKGDSDFSGAKFSFLAANIIRSDNGQTLFPSYQIREFSGIKIAFVGIVLAGVPSLVSPAAINGLTFLDEAQTVNNLIPELKDQGVETIVVLIHEGGISTGSYNECPSISGSIVDIIHRLDKNISVVISGHTHQAYNCIVDNKLVTSAASYGRLVTKIDMSFDGVSGSMLSAQANNLVVTRDVLKDPDESQLIAYYKKISAPIANHVLGNISRNLTRTTNAAGESTLGRVIADAQYEATAHPDHGHAELAFMNPGGLRTDLIYISSAELEGDGNVTYGEAFSVHPFGNNLITMTLTGQQIYQLLEQQFAGCNFSSNRILQVSRGFNYSWNDSAPACHKVDSTSISLHGKKLDLAASYRVSANSFLAEGGDSFSIFASGTNRLGGMLDIDALKAHFKANLLVDTDKTPRIERRRYSTINRSLRHPWALAPAI